MNSGLFNNKYYNQLFGGRQQRRDGTAAPAAPETHSESTESTEDTRQRLERIFGGNPKGRKPSPERAAAKAAVAARAAMTDEQYARATGKKFDASTGLFTFTNGAKAKRLENGRFQIVQGASAAKMAELRGNRKPGGKVKAIKKAAAQRAFSAYFNRKMKEAQAYNAAHMSEYPLKKDGSRNMRKSKQAAVRRAKEYALSHYRSKTLNESSPKGYLYLRKEKLTSRRNSKGQPVTRRAGPAIYSFEGVAPVARKDKPISERKKPTYKSSAKKAAVEAARRNFATRMEEYRTSQGYKARRSASRSGREFESI